MLRVGLRLALATMLLTSGGCDGRSEDILPAPDPDPAPTRPTNESAPSENAAGDLPSPDTTAGLRTVEVTLGEVERLAADRGVTILIRADGEQLGWLDRVSPQAIVTAPPGPLEFVYRAPDGTTTEVGWAQSPIDGRVVAEQPWREPPESPPPVAAAWQQGSELQELRREAQAAAVLNVVSPIWWYVTAEGTISSDTVPEYVDDIHAMGKSIWPAVAGLDADANHALLSNPLLRSEAARLISDEARLMGADGVNIDIEGFREADADDFTTFVAQVAEAVHAWGGLVSYDLVPRTDSWGTAPPELAYWSTAPQRRELAALVDYTILMSYDQYNRHRPGGPVAAPAWVEDTLVYQLRYSDPDKVILGVPFYGRVWDPEDLEAPRAFPIPRLERLAASGTAAWNETFGLPRVELEDGRFLYLEDSSVIADRLSLVDEYGLGGWAAWRLGFDSADLWDAIAGNT